MEKVCQDIQEQIPELITGALPPERAAELRQHIRQCPVCSEYLQALQADDKLLRDFTEGMQPTVARLEDKVIETLSSEPSKQPVRFVSMWRTISKSAITRFAAAAVIIIVVLIGVKIFTGRVEEERLEIVRDEDIPSSVFVEHEKPEVAAPREVAITMRKETKPASDAELEAELWMVRELIAAGELDVDGAVLSKSKRARSRGPVALSSADRAAPKNKAKIETEAKQIQEMVAVGDVEGLIEMLSVGEFPSKVAAAEHLGEIGDEKALPELERLNKEHGGWVPREVHHDSSGAFAVAICRILTWDLSEKEQIEAWFDLLEGRGSAVPKSIEPVRITVNGIVKEIPRKLNRNFDVGKRVAAELDKFDDPSIVGRLRQTENKGAAIFAVWMEVRDMDAESAIAHCMEIARTEDRAGRYGAIKCLGKFGDDAIDALDELASEGYDEAIRTLGYSKKNSEVMKLICWHLTNNKNSRVRLMAINQFYGDVLQYQQPELLQALIKALYDPNKYIRRNAAQLLSYAAYRENKPQLEKFEDAMLIALKHPDEDVRKYIMKALERLGSERFNEPVADPPTIRTDLEEQSRPPLTVQQKLETKVKPIEEKAAKALKMGPPQEAVKLYEELLELRPAYEPYEKALKKARAYVKAAAKTTVKWYQDAPYIGLKGRYSYYLASELEDMSTLKEEFDLALFLQGEHFEGWSSIFGDDPKGKDQFEKALKLHEHIVEYYPKNEYLVVRSTSAIGGLETNLRKKSKTIIPNISAYIDLFAFSADELVDSTDPRRNKPLEEADGKTQAQLDFERYYKDNMRARIIELCSATHKSDRDSLLDEIIERCAETDPKIVEMAKVTKVKIEQQRKAEAEREKAVEHHK